MTDNARPRNRAEHLEGSATYRLNDFDPTTYEIRLSGRLDARWAFHFEPLSLRHDADGTTVLSGPIADQAALHGVLQRVRDLGIPLISITHANQLLSNTNVNHHLRREDTMKVTTNGLIRASSIAAVAAGLLFVVIQPLHPADTLTSVATPSWSVVHQATCLMLILFVAGITGIYASQVEVAGWLGLIGYVALSVGLLITAAFTFVEAFIEPILAGVAPAIVSGLLGVVEGKASDFDLGALPTIYSISSALFLGGCIVFGIAIIRARVLSRAAAGLFAFGIIVSAPLTAALDAPRVAAVPIGLGLAWLGVSLWSRRRLQGSEQLVDVPLPLARQSGAA